MWRETKTGTCQLLHLLHGLGIASTSRNLHAHFIFVRRQSSPFQCTPWERINDETQRSKLVMTSESVLLASVSWSHLFVPEHQQLVISSSSGTTQLLSSNKSWMQIWKLSNWLMSLQTRQQHYDDSICIQIRNVKLSCAKWETTEDACGVYDAVMMKLFQIMLYPLVFGTIFFKQMKS